MPACWNCSPNMGPVHLSGPAKLSGANHPLQPPTLRAVQELARAKNLAVFGAFHPEQRDNAPPETGTLILLGPDEPGFWDGFSASPEFLDKNPNPLDRWSRRVINRLAQQIGGTALFPFGGPPYAPFIQWAERSGRSWQSPVGLLVHEWAGLFVSYRGALALKNRLPLPEPVTSPCVTCADKPCLTACPVSALTNGGYDLGSCHSYLETSAGKNCIQGGCAVRRACPVSQTYGRQPVQSEFHMKAFHP